MKFKDIYNLVYEGGIVITDEDTGEELYDSLTESQFTFAKKEIEIVQRYSDWIVASIYVDSVDDFPYLHYFLKKP